MVHTINLFAHTDSMSPLCYGAMILVGPTPLTAFKSGPPHARTSSLIRSPPDDFVICLEDVAEVIDDGTSGSSQHIRSTLQEFRLVLSNEYSLGPLHVVIDM